MHEPAQATTVEDVERLMATNFFGAVYLTMAALPGMLERRRGWIVNVTSVAGSIPNPNESAYGATKAALSLWSHGLAVDLHGTGVHAGALSPGPIDTDIWEMDAVYDGRRYPPSVVADGVVQMIEGRKVQLTVPRRYGAVGALYPLLGRPLRWGLRRFARRGLVD
jgi:short-subunit dehydrogenase